MCDGVTPLCISLSRASAHLNSSTPPPIPSQANFVKDIVTTHNGHWFAGITGTKFFHRALATAGSGKLALDTLLDTTYPRLEGGDMIGGEEGGEQILAGNVSF